jgi:hypothetical protein
VSASWMTELLWQEELLVVAVGVVAGMVVQSLEE